VCGCGGGWEWLREPRARLSNATTGYGRLRADGARHGRSCGLRVPSRRMIAAEFSKLFWSIEQPLLPAALFFGRREQIGGAMDGFACHLS